MLTLNASPTLNRKHCGKMHHLIFGVEEIDIWNLFVQRFYCIKLVHTKERKKTIKIVLVFT